MLAYLDLRALYYGQRTQGYSISEKGILRIVFSGECSGARLFLFMRVQEIYEIFMATCRFMPKLKVLLLVSQAKAIKDP